LRREQLTKYLAKGMDAELQWARLAGSPTSIGLDVPTLLLSGMDYYPATNRKLALNGLLRSDREVTALLDALEQGKVKATWFSEEQKKALRECKMRICAGGQQAAGTNHRAPPTI